MAILHASSVRLVQKDIRHAVILGVELINQEVRVRVSAKSDCYRCSTGV